MTAGTPTAATTPARIFTITVNPVNDRPDAADHADAMDEDAAPLSVDLRALVSDLETDDADLTYTIGPARPRRRARSTPTRSTTACSASTRR